MAKLKSCPWPHDTQRLMVYKYGKPLFPSNYMCRVKCLVCEAQGPLAYTKKDAIRLWNTRPEEQMAKEGKANV